MTNVLIVHDDLTVKEPPNTSLGQLNSDIKILHANEDEEAIAVLKGQDISILVTDLVKPDVIGSTLLLYVTKNHPEMPCIIMTPHSIPGLGEEIMRRGYHFLEKPVPHSLLAQTIQFADKQANGGNDQGRLSIPSIIQFVELEEMSCILNIHHSDDLQGKLFFSNGALLDAEFVEMRGEEAASQLLRLDDVQVSCRRLSVEPLERRIKKSAQHIVLQGLQARDERSSVNTEKKQVSQRQLFNEGVASCEKLLFQKAKNIFRNIIVLEPKNGPAWLWVSRTLFDMKKINLSLEEAFLLDPKNKEILNERNKFRSALKINVKKVARCPFCYAPIESNTNQCHFCKAYIMPNIDTLPKMGGSVSEPELLSALERFEKALMTEVNKTLLFYAGLSCLNLGYFKKASEYFKHLELIILDKGNLKEIVSNVLHFLSLKEKLEQNKSQQLWNNEQETSVFDDTVSSGVSDEKMILIVEDSALTRKIIKRILSEHNFIFKEAQDGMDALAILKENKPDLILLDIVMPKLNGYDVLRLLKKNSDLKNIPVIMMTAKNKFKEKFKARFSTANAYLTKPFEADQLINHINKHIN